MKATRVIRAALLPGIACFVFAASAAGLFGWFMVTTLGPDIEPSAPGVIEADVEAGSTWSLGVRTSPYLSSHGGPLIVESITIDGEPVSYETDGSWSSTRGSQTTHSVYSFEAARDGRLVVTLGENPPDTVLMHKLKMSTLLFVILGTMALGLCAVACAVLAFILALLKATSTEPPPEPAA